MISELQALSSKSSCMCSDCQADQTKSLSRSSSSWSLAQTSVRSQDSMAQLSDVEVILIKQQIDRKSEEEVEERVVCEGDR